MATEKNNPFFRATSQSVTCFSASLHSRRCIFEQVKTEQEERNERFLARAEGATNTNSLLTTTNC